MKRIAFYLSLVLVVLVLASCKKGQKNLFTPTSSGRPYEVLVVVNKPVWDRPAGRALFDVLDTNVPGLPQAERSFRISSLWIFKIFILSPNSSFPVMFMRLRR